MRGISVDQSVIDQIFPKKVAESKVETKTETKKVQESEEVETHTCPLCESELAEAISEEKISEHVDWMLGVLNENFEIDGGDSLDEEATEETEEDSDEEGK